MNPNVLTALAKIGGIGGIALGIVLILLQDVIASQVFNHLPSNQAHQILLIIIVGLFVLGGLGILAWAFAVRRVSFGGAKVHADTGSVAFGNDAKGNVVSVSGHATKTKHDGE